MKACRICENSENNKIHRAREMMYGTREEFDYLECGGCGTLQIVEIPADLERYYPQNYYSFNRLQEEFPTNLKSRLAARFAANYAGSRRNLLGKHFFETRQWLKKHFPPWLLTINLGINVNSKILDFGSGAGANLLKLRYLGFQNLLGADAFIKEDIIYSKNVRVLKRRLQDLEAGFDFIMMHHTFEHLPNPQETLRETQRLLRRGKYVLVRIPLISFAWQKYGVNWVQLDAPRHLFLYTEQSFSRMAEQAGFEVAKVVYDSEAFQFWASEQYAQDISMNDERAYRGDIQASIFTAEQLADFERQAQSLNERGQGDQACFYLRKP